MGHPTIYPSGVTIYDPEKCWSGYTIFQAQEVGAVLMDMNGREVNVWKGVLGMPNKIFPGGTLITSRGRRSGKYSVQDGIDLVQVDWEGNITWKFDQVEFIEDAGETPRWMARYHHDFQREGNPVGYYAPGMEPRVDGGNTLVLSHRNVRNPKISDKQLLDDLIVETTWDGDIVWEWQCSDHFDEFGFREASKNALCRNPNYRPTKPEGMGDWMHINSMSCLGPNKWYDAGDERFHPENLIVDGREANIIFIIEKKTGKVVWKLGPDYDNSPEARAIGAVNVIRVDHKGGETRLKGYNSDVIGFTRSIEPMLEPCHKKALILGTGGASKAVNFGLKSLGLETVFVSRYERPGTIQYDKITPDVVREYNVIVNCTPCGMYPHIDECPQLPYEAMDSRNLLYDLLYNPDQTLFMKKGAAQGATVKNGLEMLLLQAFASWEFWNSSSADK